MKIGWLFIILQESKTGRGNFLSLSLLRLFLFCELFGVHFNRFARSLRFFYTFARRLRAAQALRMLRTVRLDRRSMSFTHCPYKRGGGVHRRAWRNQLRRAGADLRRCYPPPLCKKPCDQSIKRRQTKGFSLRRSCRASARLMRCRTRSVR